jgi:hypothetical protein
MNAHHVLRRKPGESLIPAQTFSYRIMDSGLAGLAFPRLQSLRFILVISFGNP